MSRMKEQELWGMPLELAVGLVGLGGALLGAFVAAAATVWVARWQARETLRLQRLARLDDAVLRSGLLLGRLGKRRSESFDKQRPPTLEERDEISDVIAELEWRARGLAPGLGGKVRKVLDDDRVSFAEQYASLSAICADWLGDTSHAPGARRRS